LAPAALNLPAPPPSADSPLNELADPEFPLAPLAEAPPPPTTTVYTPVLIVAEVDM
jgi:hypothetical protein